MRGAVCLAFLALVLTACSDKPGHKDQTEKARKTPAVTEQQAAPGQPASVGKAGKDTPVPGAPGEGAAGYAEVHYPRPSGEAADRAQSTYRNRCASCHERGLAGALGLNDGAAWQTRLNQIGRQTLYQHALKGFRAMPARGTCMQCPDDEIKTTVDWILEQAGAGSGLQGQQQGQGATKAQ